MLYLCEIFCNKCTGGLSSTVAARRMNKRGCLGQKRGLRSAQQATTSHRERASEGSAKTYLDSLHTAHSQEWQEKRDKTREEAPVLTRLRVQWGRQSHTQQRQGETQTRHTRQEGARLGFWPWEPCCAASTGNQVPISSQKTHYRHKGEWATIIWRHSVFYLPHVKHWPHTEHPKYGDYNQREIHSLLHSLQFCYINQDCLRPVILPYQPPCAGLQVCTTSLWWDYCLASSFIFQLLRWVYQLLEWTTHHWKVQPPSIFASSILQHF